MRIAFTVHKFPTESLGGTEVYTQTLARTLVTFGHEVAVFYPSPKIGAIDKETVLDGVRLWRVPLPATRTGEDPIRQYWHTFRDSAIERAFVTFLEEYQPDLLHYQHVQGVSARLIELAAGRPRVATLNDYWYFCANSQLIRPDRQPCSGPALACMNCVDCATVRSDLQGLRLLRWWPCPLPIAMPTCAKWLP
jgi:glycosyltransferase involved in cell wall biosynthesis